MFTVYNEDYLVRLNGESRNQKKICGLGLSAYLTQFRWFIIWDWISCGSFEKLGEIVGVVSIDRQKIVLFVKMSEIKIDNFYHLEYSN